MNSIKTVSLVGKNYSQVTDIFCSEFGYSSKTILNPYNMNPEDYYYVSRVILIYKDDMSCGLAITVRQEDDFSLHTYFDYEPISNTFHLLNSYTGNLANNDTAYTVLDYIKNEDVIVFGLRDPSVSGPVLNALITKTKYKNVNKEIKEHFGFLHYNREGANFHLAPYKLFSESPLPTNFDDIASIGVAVESKKIITDKIIQMKPVLINEYDIEIANVYLSTMSPIYNTQKISNLFTLNGRQYVTMSEEDYERLDEADFIVDITIGG